MLGFKSHLILWTCELSTNVNLFSSPECGKGEQTRYRFCINGRHGGSQCLKPQETEKQTCKSNKGMRANLIISAIGVQIIPRIKSFTIVFLQQSQLDNWNSILLWFQSNN